MNALPKELFSSTGRQRRSKFHASISADHRTTWLSFGPNHRIEPTITCRFLNWNFLNAKTIIILNNPKLILDARESYPTIAVREHDQTHLYFDTIFAYVLQQYFTEVCFGHNNVQSTLDKLKTSYSK